MTNPNIPNIPESKPLGADGEAQEAAESVEAVEAKPSAAILAKRSILDFQVAWGIGYGDFSSGDPRASRHMEP